MRLDLQGAGYATERNAERKADSVIGDHPIRWFVAVQMGRYYPVALWSEKAPLPARYLASQNITVVNS